MTAPDVAALAAALESAFPPPESYEAWSAQVHRTYESDGEAIIAALAAQGWRITSAPEHRPGYCDRCGHAVDFHVPPGHQCSECSADDPVSAQAAPDYSNPTLVYDLAWHNSIAVRATLEGLRAEVAVRGWADQRAVLAIIDRQLAALDA